MAASASLSTAELSTPRSTPAGIEPEPGPGCPPTWHLSQADANGDLHIEIARERPRPCCPPLVQRVLARTMPGSCTARGGGAFVQKMFLAEHHGCYGFGLRDKRGFAGFHSSASYPRFGLCLCCLMFHICIKLYFIYIIYCVYIYIYIYTLCRVPF